MPLRIHILGTGVFRILPCTTQYHHGMSVGPKLGRRFSLSNREPGIYCVKISYVAPSQHNLKGEVHVSEETNWQADALCKEHPEVNFFPSHGEDFRPAKRICKQCLVQEECRASAVEFHTNATGIWGGTSERERRKLRRALKAS